MNTKKALLYALGVTIVSCVLLTVSRGIPTFSQLTNVALEIFASGFITLKLFGDEKPRLNGGDK